MHALVKVLAPGGLPVFTSNGLKLHFYTLNFIPTDIGYAGGAVAAGKGWLEVTATIHPVQNHTLYARFWGRLKPEVIASLDLCSKAIRKRSVGMPLTVSITLFGDSPLAENPVMLVA